ncbi:MAG TPA: SDR family NAD(P)-dependent oxidoreductase [Ktedonobacterales bacterium]|jgi:NAD(P)-dependent dehydrogenase (short-subunit alcohol dehydrogenase family)
MRLQNKVAIVTGAVTGIGRAIAVTMAHEGAAALAEAHHLALSAHCAASLHAAACCALPLLSPIEYFHDHARIEHMLFDGALTPRDGALHPDRTRPGLGLEFKRADAERYAV